MKILFCSPVHTMSRQLGESKHILELAEEMELLGWECDFFCQANTRQRQPFSQSLFEHLIAKAGDYDVIDYTHTQLPYSRAQLPPQPLYVARSVLLINHFETIAFPFKLVSLKAKIKHWLLGPMLEKNQKKTLAETIAKAEKTMNESDLINVSNSWDKKTLMAKGFSEDKIVVIPCGLSRKNKALFDDVSAEAPENPQVAFIGTFDFRKGCLDFPDILQKIADAVPQATFKLLGTKGMLEGADEVCRFFPQQLKEKIQVIPQYDNDQLPQLLADCSVGIFPSYIEGFGLGVIEMLAAAIPVVAYDAPGPCDILPEHYRVPSGATLQMADKVIKLLAEPKKLATERLWARQHAASFCWENVAQQTSEIYQAKISEKAAPVSME